MLTKNSAIKLLFFFMILFFFILFVFLYNFENSPDYLNYRNWFIVVNSYFSPHFVFKDPLFYFLSIFFGSLNFTVILPIITLITISFLAKINFAFKLDSLVFIIFIWLYFCRVFFIHDLVQFRVAAATGFCLLFVSNLLQSRNKKAFLWLTLSVLTHASAIFFIFLYKFVQFSRASVNTNKYIVLFLCLLGVSFFIGVEDNTFIQLLESLPFLGERIKPYLNGIYEYKNLSLVNTYLFVKVGCYALFIFVVFWSRRGLVYISVLHFLSFFCSIFGTSLFLIFRWNDSIALRLSDVFLIFDILLFSLFLNYFDAKGKGVLFIILLVLGLLLLYPSLRV